MQQFLLMWNCVTTEGIFPAWVKKPQFKSPVYLVVVSDCKEEV